MTIRRSKFIVLGFLALLLAGAVLALNIGPRRGVQEKLRRIRDAGDPTSAAELNSWYPSVPTEQNRALGLIDAGALVTTPPGNLEPNADEPITAETASALKEYLAKNEKALAAAHSAAALPQSRFPVDMSQGFSMTLPHLGSIKGVTVLLKHEAVYKAHLRDSEGALRSFQAAFAAADSVRNEPIFISDLVGIACLSITINALERALNESPFTAPQLTKLLEWLAKAEAAGLRDFQRAMVGERAVGIASFRASFQEIQALGAVPGTPPPSGTEWFKVLAFQAYRATGLRERDLECYLDAMELYIAAARSPFPAALEQTREANQKINQRFSTGLGRLAVLSRMALPALQNGIEKEAIVCARLRCAEIALAIELYRLDHGGSLPESTTLLAPKYLYAVPNDPFDGTPLQYERLPEKGYQVWSVQATAANKRPGKTQITTGVRVKR